MGAQEAKYYIATLFIVILVCIIIIGFTWIFYKYKKTVFILQKKVVTNHIASLEYERERIAADLHDEIGPTLAAIKIHIESFESNMGKVQSTIKPLSPLIIETINKLAAISKNLAPKSLQLLGLVPAINQLIEIFEPYQNTKISFITNYSKCLPIEIELQLYRIVQEAIYNAIKHANATKIDIKLHMLKNELALLISDNGKGIEITSNKSISGNGLNNLKKRALIIGGEFNIYTKTGKGSDLQFKIPLNA